MQPWVYQYLFMLAALGLFSWRYDDVAGRDLTLNICRFIVASIYFWSGLQKLNPEFFNAHFVWVLAPIQGNFSGASLASVLRIRQGDALYRNGHRRRTAVYKDADRGDRGGDRDVRLRFVYAGPLRTQLGQYCMAMEYYVGIDVVVLFAG